MLKGARYHPNGRFIGNREAKLADPAITTISYTIDLESREHGYYVVVSVEEDKSLEFGPIPDLDMAARVRQETANALKRKYGEQNQRKEASVGRMTLLKR